MLSYCTKAFSSDYKVFFWSCRWGGGAAGGSSGGRLGDGDSSEEEEEAAELGRAEELRRERLNALVKRNLTAILLEVTDAMFGAFAPSSPSHLFLLTFCQKALYRYVAKVLNGEVTPLFSAVNFITVSCALQMKWLRRWPKLPKDRQHRRTPPGQMNISQKVAELLY